jgi:hypothetical protein
MISRFSIPENKMTKRTIMLGLALGTISLLSSCATNNGVETTEAPGVYGSVTASDIYPETQAGRINESWPINFDEGSTHYTIYEPECDSWDGHEMSGHSSLAARPAGRAQPFYGVISFKAITLVDKATQTATLANFQMISADFPWARNEMKNFLVPILIHFSKNTAPLALDRLEESLVSPAPPEGVHLDNTPPKIIFATRPAVLVYIDGSPVWRPVPGTGLERVVNTRMLLLKDEYGHYYLHLFDGYLQSASLDGPWTLADQPPAGAAVAENLALASGQVDLMTGWPDESGKMPSLYALPAPDVLIATQPTELIEFGGAAEFATIPGTGLLYALNTSGNVFKWLTNQQTYILISGRWYSAPSLDGPWQFIPGKQLPPDFAKIPDDSPKANVKASVPGTIEAKEALIQNSIPESTAIARTGQMPNPQIDGAMQLETIEGTPLHYVVNSATAIIEVDPQTWYACQNGVWYEATSGNGPWTVATSVPPVIYSIPPSSPLHNVTYVQIFGSTADEVYEGYTPGYMGTEVGDDGTVVYGTGYDYAPWIGAAWYGPPATWGWGFDDYWSPEWGWGFNYGFGWGWGFGCYPPHPWWGGWPHGRGTFHHGGGGHGFGGHHGFGHGGHGFGHGGGGFHGGGFGGGHGGFGGGHGGGGGGGHGGGGR